ncbi:N-acetylmuramoyl-L-alanine amidase [Actinoplanes sp. NPDC020271]|uniref:N-acetylmuramoyl-L-alanine amidase n=1 Tax=Actinoplanes sp. NPDC020271 TaxID=3363896 RepID=UPI003790B2E2
MNRRKSAVAGTAVAVLAAAGGVTALLWPSDQGGQAAAALTVAAVPPDPAAQQPELHAELDSLDLATTPNGGAELPQRDTRKFSMVSVSWNDPAVAPQGAIEVRTRSVKTGSWSGWETLGVAEPAADRPDEVARTHGATDAIWTGLSDGVAARIAGGGTVPAALKINLIDTDAKGGKGGQGGGEEVSPSAQPSVSDSAEPAGDEITESPDPQVSDLPTEPATEPVPDETSQPPATTAPPAGTPSTGTGPAPESTSAVPVPTSTVPVKAQLPAYVSRAGWNADESLVKYAIEYTNDARMVWVHHTGFGNAYTCAQSASVVRGIQVNDVKVKGLSDMGYNFLVDACGTLYEGRKGGVTNAVIGAHTVGFNTGSVGIALLGDYTTLKPSDAAMTTIAQVAAARLGAYNHSPTGIASMTEGVANRYWKQGSTVTFPAISGHKDGEKGTNGGYLTECPGTNLYSQLNTIRARSVQQITGLAGKSLAGGLSVGGIFYVRNAVTFDWVVSTPSAQIAKFEVQIDGQTVATLPGTARTSGNIAVPTGSHWIRVRATHVAGGTALTGAYKVVGDVTAPSLSGPAIVTRTGTVTATSVPIAVTYKASDAVKLYTVTATKPARTNLVPTGTAWKTTVKPGVNTTYSLTARDASLNGRTAAVTTRTTLVAETAGKKTGTWATRKATGHLGGRALAATKKNTKLTYAFTGRSASLIFSRGTTTGKADIYLDGKKVATVDTKSGSTSYRQALWSKSFKAGKHTVVVVVAGTSGRPAVITDGLAYVS